MKRALLNIGRGDEKGIALVFMFAVLALLAAVGVSLGSVSTLARKSSALGEQATRARLVARSGVEYSRARLMREFRVRSAQDQADDWRYRDDYGSPIGTSENPSYAQGEPFEDTYPAGPGNGKFDAGQEAFVDLDGDGRREAFSGRVRGPRGAFSYTFRLKILPEQINVNQGFLDTQDRNGNGVPDGRDACLPVSGVDSSGVQARNRRVAVLINSLGILAGASGTDAGDRLIASRPAGGYRLHEQLRNALGASDYDKLKDYLSVEGNADRSTTAWIGGGSSLPISDPRTPLSVYEAPRLAMAASFRGVALDGNAISNEDSLRAADLIMAQRSTLTGFYDTDWKQENLLVRKDLHGAINQDRLLLFPVSILEGIPSPAWWVNNKTDAILENADPYDPVATRGRENLSFHSNDMPRWVWPDGDTRVRRPRQNRIANADGAGMGTTELSFLPPMLFRVECAARAGGGRGSCDQTVIASVQAGAVLDLKSQRDFENIARDPGCGPGVRMSGRPVRDRVQTSPFFSLDSCADLKNEEGYEPPRYWGEIKLMDASDVNPGDPASYPADLKMYFPMWEGDQPYRDKATAGKYADNFKEGLHGYDYAYGGPGTLKDSLLWKVPDPDTDYQVQPATAAGPFYYTWGAGGKNAGGFPLVAPASGKIEAGTVEQWGAQSWGIANGATAAEAPRMGVAMAPWTLATLGPDALYQVQYKQANSFGAVLHQILGPAAPSLRKNTHIATTYTAVSGPLGVLLPGTATLYQDGLAVGADLYDAQAINPAQVISFQVFSDEVKAYTQVHTAAFFAAHALHRFWVKDPLLPVILGTDLHAAPSFLSPFYELDQVREIQGGRWDGFIPLAIKTAAHAANLLEPDPARQAWPIRIEAIGYDADGTTERFRDTLDPLGKWKNFDLTSDLAKHKVKKIRFKVQLDASMAAAVKDSPTVCAVQFVYAATALRLWEEK